MASKLHQPAIRVPFEVSLASIPAFGMAGLRCRIDLFAETIQGGVSEPIEFAVDSGASYSLIDLELAHFHEFPTPSENVEVELPLRTPTGIRPFRVRPGRIRCWWNADRTGHPFDWPVLFRVGGPLGSPSILGLGGVIRTCSWHFDGLYSPDAPYGGLALTDAR